MKYINIFLLTITLMFASCSKSGFTALQNGVGNNSSVGSNAGKKQTTVVCNESQEWTYAVDNTGTVTNEAATWTFTLSNGTSIVVNQVDQGSGGQWTPQMQQVGDDLQIAADNAGISWFVETRCILSATSLVGCGGFSGPPSAVVGQALWEGGQRWRYINIQICPGEPTISNVVYESASRTRTMVTAGPVLGPKEEFRVKETCVGDIVHQEWFIRTDSQTFEPATAGQIPNCAAQCGSLSTEDPPEQAQCTFETVEACDNNNSSLTSDFTQLITRIVAICNGVPTEVNYYQESNGALIDYPMVGDFVDCATGEVIPLPTAECNDFISLGNMYEYVPTEIGTLVEWWSPTALGGSAAPHGNVSDIFTNDGSTWTHVNGAPDNSYYASSFSVDGTNASDFLTGMGGLTTAQTTGTDQFKLSAFFNLRADGIIRDNGTRTGERGLISSNICCAGDLETIEERTVDTNAAERGVFNNTPLSAGVQYAEGLISDLSAWANLTLEVSYDDGVAWEPIVGYKTKPSYNCIPVIKCTDTGVLLNAVTMEELDGSNLYCDDPCNDNSSGGGYCINQNVEVVDDEDEIVGDQTICASQKMGAEIESLSAGSATHDPNVGGGLFTSNTTPLNSWSGNFIIVDSAGTSHTMSNGQTITGLASGATQSVTYVGYINWTDANGDTFGCNVDKLISAQFTVQ